eukprot:TRINITY_DN23949_c0_g1_i3.p1 TRINITY_DN23949_c0_g1~~TRINITY_DN23949_c0_g1_i3.p1  ORF type:complete len:476 (+),score=87.70 TRINITY_DN23949_c0_g1_i3:131-1429(+)
MLRSLVGSEMCIRDRSRLVRTLCTERGTRTVAIHAGETINPTHRASAPDICMSSTFAVDRVLSFNAAEQDPDDRPFVYTRWANPTIQQLESKLCALENAAGCLAYASGMAASTAVVLSRLGAGDHLVCSDINYPGTAELFRSTLPRLGIRVSPVDTSSLGQIEAACTPDTRMIFVETPANPVLRLADIAGIAQLCAQKNDLSLVVDSTFSTPIGTKPLELGADFVVHSLTKYIGGHGDAMGGAVLGRELSQMNALMNEATVHYGGTISPMNAWLISRGAATLPLRMKAHQENAFQVARFLEGHHNVKRVLYPGLESHPQHELARVQMSNYSGMMAFQVQGNPAAAAHRMMKELEIIHYAVSLGHHRSLIFLIETDNILNSSFALEDPEARWSMEAKYRQVAGDGVFRLSVGLEDPEDLIRDLSRVLDKLSHS